MATEQPTPPTGTPQFVGIHMKCCNVYVRANINHAKDAFVGWCPRCCAQVRIPIVHEGGSKGRFFSAS